MWTSAMPIAHPRGVAGTQELRDRQSRTRPQRPTLAKLASPSRSSSVTRSLTSEDMEKDLNNLHRVSEDKKPMLRRNGSSLSSAANKFFKRSRTVTSTTTSSSSSEISENDSEERKERKRDKLRRKLAAVLSPSFYLESISVTYPVADGFVPVFF